jgi:hypothetical protein
MAAAEGRTVRSQTRDVPLAPEPLSHTHTPPESPVGSVVVAKTAVAASRSGLQIDPRMPFESWQALGAQIAVRAEGSTWWLGDWLVFGKRQYGERYKAAIAVTGLGYQTLRNYAVVATRFELSRRRDNLSFQHHAEVSALPDEEQQRWLDLAANHAWSKRELRARVRESTAPGRRAKSVVRIAVAPDREQRWRDAAKRSECKFDEWLARSLDAAAANQHWPSSVPIAGPQAAVTRRGTPQATRR